MKCESVLLTRDSGQRRSKHWRIPAALAGRNLVPKDVAVVILAFFPVVRVVVLEVLVAGGGAADALVTFSKVIVGAKASILMPMLAAVLAVAVEEGWAFARF